MKSFESIERVYTDSFKELAENTRFFVMSKI